MFGYYRIHEIIFRVQINQVFHVESIFALLKHLVIVVRYSAPETDTQTITIDFETAKKQTSTIVATWTKIDST